MNSLNCLILFTSIEKPPAILCPPPFIKILFWIAARITAPISNPKIDLAEALPILSFKDDGYAEALISFVGVAGDSSQQPKESHKNKIIKEKSKPKEKNKPKDNIQGTLLWKRLF